MKANVTYPFTDEDRLAIGGGDIASHEALKAFMVVAIADALPAIRKAYYKKMAEEYAEKASD